MKMAVVATCFVVTVQVKEMSCIRSKIQCCCTL